MQLARGRSVTEMPSPTFTFAECRYDAERNTIWIRAEQVSWVLGLPPKYLSIASPIRRNIGVSDMHSYSYFALPEDRHKFRNHVPCLVFVNACYDDGPGRPGARLGGVRRHERKEHATIRRSLFRPCGPARWQIPRCLPHKGAIQLFTTWLRCGERDSCRFVGLNELP